MTDLVNSEKLLESKRMVGAGDVLLAIRCSEKTLSKLIANRQFPAPMFVGSARRWFASEILEWIAARNAERTGAVASV